jgi:glycerol-1-phosphate dehydrogenase [NAD(P)+]
MSSSAISIAEALRVATDTRSLEIGRNILGKVPEMFRAQFGVVPAILITDRNTVTVAGKQIVAAFERAKMPLESTYIIEDPNLYAEYRFVDEVEAVLRKTTAIPIAVGSGTINDLVKLAAHNTGRQYMCVGTAASMDGYTAFGASITKNGSKQTFLCPAPRAVLADLDVICGAPPRLNASGYADLVAKVAAGADWLLADALGAEPLHPQAWAIVQDRLKEMIAEPEGIPTGELGAIERLIEALMLGGFAMQAAKSSRAASGAEHQFSHLWDMEHHTHNGEAPSHGFKVGIGTLAITALYEYVLKQPLERLDVEACCARSPKKEAVEQRIKKLFPEAELYEVAHRECLSKHVGMEELKAQLQRLREVWPTLKPKLQSQLLTFAEMQKKLRLSGAPYEPEQISISRERLRDSYWKAYTIRRRFTILDVVVRAGLLEPALKEIFGEGGPWSISVRTPEAATA